MIEADTIPSIKVFRRLNFPDKFMEIVERIIEGVG
ncbi:hypothetical protein ACV242_003203 [Peribacillus simplex]